MRDGELTIVTTDGACKPFFKLLARVVFLVLAAESTWISQRTRTLRLADAWELTCNGLPEQS